MRCAAASSRVGPARASRETGCACSTARLQAFQDRVVDAHVLGLVAGDFAQLLDNAGRILDGSHPELGAQGHAAWQSEHRWEQIVGRYESVFDETLEARTTPGG